MPDILAPLTPIYPFGQPGDPILLHKGRLIIDNRAVNGQIEFRLAPQPDIVWRADEASSPAEGNILVSVEHSAGPAVLRGRCTKRGTDAVEGSLTTGEIGSATAELHRVLVHWLNLPALRSPFPIGDRATGSWYTGRWVAEVGDWAIVLDRRPDHKATWEQVRAKGSIAVTHVMEIRRTDDRPFTAPEVQPVLDALHLGMSFALGRWVAPALPVGLDHGGNRVWEHWGARLCTAGAPGTLRWWFEQREWELAQLLNLLVARFADPDQRFGLRFLLSSAVAAAAGGFVEQRIMTAFAALEHLTWTRLVTIGGMSNTRYRDEDFPAHRKLSHLLAEAGITDMLDDDALPALKAVAQRRPAHAARTGPAIAGYVRNMIVHPTGYAEQLYRQHDDLVQQAWFLTQDYLVLLILHHLGYTGSYRRMLKPGGWAGDVEPVPWAPQT
jgi:hypothetical protein